MQWQRECNLGEKGHIYVSVIWYFTTPGITWLPPRCQQDEVLAFAPFTDRRCSYTIKGVILIRLGDHLTLPAVDKIKNEHCCRYHFKQVSKQVSFGFFLQYPVHIITAASQWELSIRANTQIVPLSWNAPLEENRRNNIVSNFSLFVFLSLVAVIVY